MDSTIEGPVAPEQISAKTDRLPSLDGLRAISIVFVLIGHLSGTQGFIEVDLGIGNYAHLGVVVFFVISGFLITRLLTAEHNNCGRVSLKLFYGRRALRLFPASYVYLACMAGLGAAGVFQLSAADLWHAATYTINYRPEPAWVVGHLWSLSVEEQFYLLWPFAFVLAGPRRAVWIAGATIVMGPVARSLSWLFLRGTGYYDLALFPVVADSLAMGCLLAMVSDRLERQNWYLQLFKPIHSLGLAALVLLINRYLGYTVVHVFGTSLINIALAILIHRSVYHPDDRVGQFLNWRPIAFVGVLSYSLYVWQQPFLNRHSAEWISAFPQNLGLAIAAALMSYLLLEKPLFKLRRHLRAT